MQKLIVSLVAAATLLSTGVASAQTYYSGSCGTTYTRDLTVGSRGSDVTSLQSFLVAQNYPGGGSWMITGYYGQATAAAVRN
jgi:peptidoglycan hydrolase-like protein with peptidoglycan-binding domain